ncbi:exocyst complex component 3-like protein 4 [Periophthalmus magnuspinnatus]|uniref:exocyst complex component 3-like protein 4 n=1 Tax=Periophthalmus magnuspinnatus TaxID=409849 RepID=UPI00145B245E|nr:exocyst complex component 3-like protein 4 [Periophthalmus magnuspinnatus]
MDSVDEDRVSVRSNSKTPLGVVKSLRTSIRKAAAKSPLSPNSKGSKVNGDPTCPPPSPKSCPSGESMDSVDEDRVSVRSNSKTPLGMVKTLRTSIRKAAAKSPLSPLNKGSKVNGDPTCPPPSPSPSAVSPLKNVTFFQKNDLDSPSPKTKGLSRSSTDPNLGSNSLLQRGAQIRRSLFGTKKERKDVTETKEETKDETKVDEEEEREDEEPGNEEVDEMYTLPELPHTPLSVMQINKLIENEVLEEAYMNLLALRVEFQTEVSQSGACGSVNLSKKEKDLNLLYTELKAKVCTIVRDSNSLPARNKKLLEFVARIIQEEERRASDLGDFHESWVDIWKSAIQDGVRTKVAQVQLTTQDQNQSWLAVHLGILGKTVVSDLEVVRRELRWSYPRSFKVFSEYVKSYNRVLGQHVMRLETQTTEVKDILALLSWILNRYKSEVLGHVSFQVDMTDLSTDLDLEPGFISRLKDKYCTKVQEQLRVSLSNITDLEQKEFWSVQKEPETEEGALISDMHMDIWTLVKGFVTRTRDIEPELEQRVTCCCLMEIKHFPKRFELEFRRHCDVLKPQPIWTQYLITYINSFSTLLEHMEGYRLSCPSEVEALAKEVKWFNIRLLQELQDQFKDNVKIPLRRMMSRKWLTNDEDFKELYQRTEELSQHCSVLQELHSQELASALHLHVSREYLGQMMKSNYSCKNRKHEKAANKIRAQWNQLQELFRNMESRHEWLYPVGGAVCDIIGQKHASEIKNHLSPVVQHCPDFGRKHLVAVLYFRGLVRGRDHRQILQNLCELKKKAPAPNKERLLFSEMQVTMNQDCLSNLPYSCLSLCIPQN